jgi:hypothetical protein
MRRAPHDEGQNPRRFQEKATSLSSPQSPQRSRRKPVSQDAALQEGVELVPDEGRQVRTGGGFDVRTEGLGVLLDQSVQRGLLRAAALLADRGTFG